MRGGLPIKHEEMPSDARWFDAKESPDGKAGYFRDNGHAVVPTIYAKGLIAEPGAAKRIAVTIPFYRSGYPVGRDFAKHAQRLAVTIEGETETGEIKKVSLRGPPVGIWRISSEIKNNSNGRPYYVPVVTLVAKVGQPGLDRRSTNGAMPRSCARASRPATCGRPNRPSRRRWLRPKLPAVTSIQIRPSRPDRRHQRAASASDAARAADL